MKKSSFGAVVLVIILLIPVLALPESESRGMSVLREAKEMDSRATTKDEKLSAAAKYLEALQIFQQDGYHKGIFICANNLGIIQLGFGQFKKAGEYFEIAQGALDRTIPPSPQDKLALLNNLSVVHKHMGRYSQALKDLDTSLELTRETKNKSLERKILYSLGAVYFEMGIYSSALEKYNKSLDLANELDDAEGQARAFYGLAQALTVRGQYRQAEENYRKALSACPSLGPEQNACEGAAFNGLGLLYEGYGMYDHAVEYFQKSLEAAIRAGYEPASSLFNIARIKHFEEDYDKALSAYQQSLRIYERSGDIGNAALVKKLISYLYVDKCEKGLSPCDMEKAEEYARASDQWVALGRLELAKKNYSSAQQYYEKALAYAEKRGDIDGLFICCTGLGSACEELNDLQSAKDYYSHAIESVEEMRAGLTRGEKLNFFQVEVGGFSRVAPYKGLARVQYKMGQFEEAFKTSEYTKARVFAESMSKGSSQDIRLPQDIISKDQDLNDRLTALLKQRFHQYQSANEGPLPDLETEIKSAKAELNDHIKMLRNDYPLYAATKYPHPMGIDQIMLKDDEWAAAFDVTDQGVIVYLLKGRNLVNATLKLISKKQLDQLVRKFRDPLEVLPEKDNLVDKLKSFDLDTGKRLARLLIGDLLAYLPAGVPLLIVPDDSLGVLPFEMLGLGEEGHMCGDGTLPRVCAVSFFGDRNPIYYSQSVTAFSLARMRGNPKASSDAVLVMADPVFQPTDERLAGPREPHNSALSLMEGRKGSDASPLYFERLERTAELARSLEEIFGNRSQIYTGLDASKANLIQRLAPEMQQFDKIVFATHGYFGQDLPGITEPALILTMMPPGADGYLFMSDVMNLDVRAGIVALTACHTGLGKRISGEGTMGMGRAFQYAGAKSVLMTLWSVSEAPSISMVKAFFVHLSHGKSKLDSLRLARSEVREQGFDHPFFWASFVLVGEPD